MMKFGKDEKRIKHVLIGLLACLLIAIVILIMVKANDDTKEHDVNYFGFESGGTVEDDTSDEASGEEKISLDKLPMIPIEPAP